MYLRLVLVAKLNMLTMKTEKGEPFTTQ